MSSFPFFFYSLLSPSPVLKLQLYSLDGEPQSPHLSDVGVCVCDNVLSYCPRSFSEGFPQTNLSPNKFIHTYMLTSQINAVKMTAVCDIFYIKVQKGGNNEA